jgi:NDP-hexose 2,3-enoyl reductase
VEITRLGRTGLKVSRLCLGTMNFGPRTSEQDAQEIMARALGAGVSFFDTADIYGPNGLTEEIVGRWLAKDDHREQVVLATKLYRPMGPGPNDGGLSARHIVKACEASLRRLQTDWIDIYQMHHVERTTPWEEIWQAMEVLIAQGKVIYVGSSNFAGWHIARAQEVARSRGMFGLVSEQSLYNLMSRTVEHEVLPACQYYGIGVIPWSRSTGVSSAASSGAVPLDGGAMTKRARSSRRIMTRSGNGRTSALSSARNRRRSRSRGCYTSRRSRRQLSGPGR